MDNYSIDFMGIINENCPTTNIEINHSKLSFINYAIKGNKSLVPDISDERFDLMQAVVSRLHDKEGDIEYVVCSLINKEFEENDSRLDWVVNLFDSSNYYGSEEKSYHEKPALKVRLSNQWVGANINHFSIIKDILEEKYTISITNRDDYDLVIDGPFDYEKINKKKAFRVFFTGEAIPAKIEGYDLSLGFDYIEGHDNYIRLPLYYLYFGDLINSDYQRKGECNPNKPYFACFLVSNGNAVHRNEMFYELSSYKIVTSGGPHLNNIDKIISKSETYSFLSQCKFVISYENNIDYVGYITEKVFQAYFAGSIPIYSSHQSGQQDLNQKAIISAQQFEITQEIINYIIEIDNDDQRYCNIWNNTIINDSKKNYAVIKNKIREKLNEYL
jgi:alpha(1,3/1,4) fucosyltransferase